MTYLVLWTVKRNGRVVRQWATWGTADQHAAYAEGLPAGRWEAATIDSKRAG
jgi:hypothetical protein